MMKLTTYSSIATACILVGLACGIAQAKNNTVTASGAGATVGTVDDVAPTNAPPKTPRLRDPFWKVGHVPYEMQASLDKTEAFTANWPDAEAKLRVSAIQPGQDGKIFAIVNGKVLESGGTISVLFRKFIYTWSVTDIHKKTGIKLDRRTARPATK
jgi:hypothetical protein